MSDIFLSYATEDRERGRLVYSALADHGWSVFWDRAIPPGKTWRLFLEEQLARARAILVLWTVASVESSWVVEEAEEGKRRQMLIPVLLDSVRVPVSFRTIQSADLSGWSGDPNDPRLLSLIQDIEHIIGSPPTKAVVPKEPIIRPGNVFISYSREDNDYVQNLIGFLRNSGLSAWADDRIDYGDLWWRTIVANIRSCIAIVVVMTPNSEHSKWVEREVMFADNLGKPIFPLLRDGEGFPLLIGVQHHDVRDKRMPPSSFITSLTKLARSDPGSVPDERLSKDHATDGIARGEFLPPGQSRLGRWLKTVLGIKVC